MKFEVLKESDTQFVLYEEYVDEEAFQAHRVTEHFLNYQEKCATCIDKEKITRKKCQIITKFD